jgi:exodeoxyribonuclease V alpha subunit
MELPVIVEYVRSFGSGWALISCNLNPYSERYTAEMETMVAPYINKKYGSFTVTATLSDENEEMRGGQFIFIGDFINNPKYGYQFKSDFFYEDLPATEDGLIIFLMMLPNIKESRSRSIVKKFGVEGTIDILNNDINKLIEISGITEKRLDAIKKVWDEKSSLRDLYQFLLVNKISCKLADPIYKKWGKEAKNVLINNPYKLSELRGIGFISADKFAHSIIENVPIEFRTLACIQYILNEDLENSNLCMPYANLKTCVSDIIKKCDNELNNKDTSELCIKTLPDCIKKNLDLISVVQDIESKINYVYLKEILRKERYISSSLLYRHLSDKKEYICSSHDIKQAEMDISNFCGRDIKLDDCQKDAVISAFSHKISIITGGGGSGKSTICRCIYSIAQKKGLSIRMMSPTGKASQVLESKTGCHASTIHRGLKLMPGEDVPRENIYQDILLIDEVSMCGIDTMYALMKAMESNIWGHIVFVGDKNQLPSVSAGNFLSDIMESGCANVIILNKIHRQGENSYISLLANKISNGETVSIPRDADDIEWRNLDVDNLEKDLIKFIEEYIENNSIDDLQLISPMKKGNCGVYAVNSIIQKKMAKIKNMEDKHLKYKLNDYYIGDRVIQNVNNYDKMIFNGDMGIITDLGEKVFDSSVSDKKEKFIEVCFNNDLNICFWGNEIEQIQLAWCVTVHKFQGSQSPNVVFVLSSEATNMMSKELVYTAFTRAEKKLDIFGHHHAFRSAPSKSSIKKRYTNFVKFVNGARKGSEPFKILGET